ncbi:cysteine proteinase [Decorospora gaudefroyi]|uniref:ubiquitinyl hydrolase 1 n=1 Tax=Decorospora gaudefroyi TaxID=184978 RepID=A0A6A5KW46_9PLEO|nr:cysteine proteinase [Decorospora gaudefroyi]
MAPGKTAPRLLQDLLTYDARYEERAGRNLLTSPPPQHDAKGPAVAAVPFRNCRHGLFTKIEQSQLPAVGAEPDRDTTYKVAAYCTKCRWHVDVVVGRRNEAAQNEACGKANPGYPLHHFLYEGEDNASSTHGLGAQLRPRTYTFRCSAPACPVDVRISMKPPRFSDHDIETLTNQAQLRRRWEAAKLLAGDRADANMARRVDSLDYLNTYLSDSLKPTKGKARIPLLNKKFLKAFGKDCDAVLIGLGFTSDTEEDNDGTVTQVWYLPKPEGPKSALDSTLRNVIEDARYELNTLILNMPESEREGCRHTPLYPTPSRGDIERILACADSDAKVKGRETRNTEEDHPYYASLGAVGDFDDALILFAFSRQGTVDIENKAYYFECLQDLATGRESEVLGTEVAMLASQGFVSKRDTERAYQYFSIDPVHASVISDEHIIGQFKARLADISPLQADEARRQLRVLGDVRNSDSIRAEASGAIETYEQAMAWFDLDRGQPDDFVQTMFLVKTQDNPACQETAQKALSIIAETRESDRLRRFLKFGSMTEPEMDLGDAYAAFQVQDRSAELDLAVLRSGLLDQEGPRMQQAFNLIEQDQIQRFGDKSHEPSRPEPRRNNYPLETWPVGLRNIGNTCYLNSVLQFLFTIKPLRELILNCEEHLQDPSPEALKDKKVGRMAITAERVVTAQKFVRELRAFYNRMITAPTDTVQPAIDLASLALCRTDNPGEAPSSANVDVAESAGLGTIDGAAISGPMLPPSDDANRTAPADPTTPADSVMNDDGGPQSDDSPKIMEGNNDDVPPAPTRDPPPIPPRPETKPAMATKTKIGRIEESALQQDAAEVMSNIFDLISCAMHGEGILREGEQDDAIKKLFYSDVTTVLETAEGTQKNQELRGNFMVTTGRRDRSLYAILDEDFGKSDIEEERGTRYDYIERAAAIQIINVKRIQYEKRQQQPVYDHSHISLDKTLYMDRYLSKTPTLDEAQLLELRQAQWSKQRELRDLDARRTKLQTTGIDGMNLPDCLEATSEFIDDLLAENIEQQEQQQAAQDSLPTPPPELADTLHDKAKHLAKDLEGMDSIMTTLEAEIESVFRDCQDVPYRLHAVFTHRGDVKGGHYWIYIYDFQNNCWRWYNDDSITPIVESEVLDPETGKRPKVSTGVVYIRADLVEELTEAVCRRPEPVEEEAHKDVEMQEADDDDDQMPDLHWGDVQVIEGVEKE